jgi:cytidine deaminase
MSDLDDRLELAYLESRASLHPITDEDIALVELVRQQAEKYCERGFHQLVAIGIGHRRKYRGLQEDDKIGDLSRCAERNAIIKASEHQDRIRLIATGRKAPEDGKVYLVPPCMGCREKLLQYCGTGVMVILPFGGDKIIKLPVKVLYPMAYAIRQRMPVLPRMDVEKAARTVEEWERLDRVQPTRTIRADDKEWLKSEEERWREAVAEERKPKRRFEPNED